MNEIEAFFEKLKEPNKSVFLFLKNFILNYHTDIKLYYKWSLPYLYYKEKPLCYIWKDKKTNHPYIGFSRGFKIDHPSLESGNRNTIKIFPINPNEDIDIELLSEVLQKALVLY